jgi:tRNA threonylcarbamoyladenosine biosynthesis protein TsaB
MYILHIETSTKVCSVALSREDQVISWEDKGDAMNHTALLAPMIAGILNKNNLTANDLGAISISSGPGSYTGLRVGSSTAKALAYSLGIPLIAVPTLEALSFAALEAHDSVSDVVPMIDARRDEVYAAIYNRDLQIQWPDHAIRVTGSFMEEYLTPLRKAVCCGDGSFKVKSFLPGFPNLVVDEAIICSARNLVKPSWSRICNKETEDVLHFIPRYLKPPNITQPRKTA